MVCDRKNRDLLVLIELMEQLDQYKPIRTIPICLENFQIFDYIYMIEISPGQCYIGTISFAPDNKIPTNLENSNLLLFLEVDKCAIFYKTLNSVLQYLFQSVKYGLYYGNYVEIIRCILYLYMNTYTDLTFESTFHHLIDSPKSAEQLVMENMKDTQHANRPYMEEHISENKDGFIYLIRPREYLLRDEKIYKIGRTNLNINGRIMRYTPNSKIIFFIRFEDTVKAETDLKLIYRAFYRLTQGN